MRKFNHIQTLSLALFAMLIMAGDLNGQIDVELDGGIKIGNSTTTDAGTIRYDGTEFQGYNGTSWNSFTGAGSSPWTTSGANIYYNTGNVGIGTTSPLYALDILSNSSISARIISTNATSNNLYMFVNGTGATANRSFLSQQTNQFRFGNNRPGNNFDWWATTTGGTGRTIMTMDADDGYLGIGTSTPAQLLHLNFSGTDGLRIEGDGTGDARAVWLSNGGGNHFIFDDNSEGNDLTVQFSNDFVIQSGLTPKLSINGTTGVVDVSDELKVSGKVTASNDIELRGSDPVIDFWNPSPPGIGAQIKFDENSSSGGNAGSLEFRNYQLVGEIEFYTSTSNLNIRMNDTNIYSYEDFSPWLHKTTNLGLNGKAWDNVYYDDLINQGAASFNDRVVTEEILNYPPTDKVEGSFDYMTERGTIELDPAKLPADLYEDNGILTDEMVTYNYKANYEQQLQINAMKELIEALQAEIIKLKSK